MGVFASQATASAYGYLNIDKEFAEYVAKGIAQARIPEAPDSVRLRFERSDRSGPYDIVKAVQNKFHAIKKDSRNAIKISPVSLHVSLSS